VADNVALKGKTGAYLLLLILQAAQVIAVPSAVILETIGVVQAVTGREASAERKLDNQLARRLGWYVTSKYRFVRPITIDCREHLADESVSQPFLDACARFERKPVPSLAQAKALETRLTTSH
jgi:hypothetical protein